jgi:hypothetical protein
MKKLTQVEFLRAIQVAGLASYHCKVTEEAGKPYWRASFATVNSVWLTERNALARISPDFELTYERQGAEKILTVSHPAA